MAMAYAEYDFYKNKYHGDTIAESDFPKWADKASRQIDVFTSRRLLSAYPEDDYTDEQIKLCVCELAEKMMETYKYLKASALNDEGHASIVKSVSAGSESITYATGETVYASVIKDDRSRTAFYRVAITEYLNGLTDANGICLLYAGV